VVLRSLPWQRKLSVSLCVFVRRFNSWCINGKFISGDYDKIEWYIINLKNATPNCSNEQFLPLATVQSDWQLRLELYFWTVKEEIIMTLIPKSLKTQLYKAIRDSFLWTRCSYDCYAQGNRQCDWFEKQLKLTYNKARNW
jgi:F-type H+-transporting ATPase subunit gamma